MKNIFTFLFFITTPFFMSSQVLWDDFEQNRVGYYDFVHGGMTTRYANPDVNNSVNTSPICAQYVRNPGELWDVLVIVGNGPIDDVSSYVDGTKTMIFLALTSSIYHKATNVFPVPQAIIN